MLSVLIVEVLLDWKCGVVLWRTAVDTDLDDAHEVEPLLSLAGEGRL